MDVSFITINYNSTIHTINLINSIIKHTSEIDFEIVITDNASEDAQFLELKNFIEELNRDNIKLIRNKINTGFSSGNMNAVNHSSGSYLLFINNDCEIKSNVAIKFKDFLNSNPTVGLASCMNLDENNGEISAYKRFPTPLGQLFGKLAYKLDGSGYPMQKTLLSQPTAVEVVTGACMFFRSTVFKKIGGFDQVLFLYCEEEDISKRVINSGYKIMFLPEIEIIHYGGGSTTNNQDALIEYYISYNHLINKHYSPVSIATLKLALFFKLLSRAIRGPKNLKILMLFMRGFPNKLSLRYKQKVID